MRGKDSEASRDLLARDLQSSDSESTDLHSSDSQSSGTQPSDLRSSELNSSVPQLSLNRRLFLARLGLGAGVVGATVASSPAAGARVAEDAPWQPARHAQDDWFDKIQGEHRLVFDTTSPDGMALALRFAGNYFVANKEAYGLKDSNLAVVIVARHKSTSFCYSDAMWAKYGKQLSEHSGFTDPKTKKPPALNVYATAHDAEGHPGPMAALIKKSAHFAVCEMSTRGIATMIAEATGAKIDSIVKEIAANLVGNARMVPAGIVAVNRAQERGYSVRFLILTTVTENPLFSLFNIAVRIAVWFFGCPILRILKGGKYRDERKSPTLGNRGWGTQTRCPSSR